MHQRGMRAEFQPDIHSEIRERIDRRSKLHWLANSASPVSRIATRARTLLPADRTKERRRLRLRLQIREGLLQRLRRRLHQGMMERMIHAHEPGENAFRLKLREHGF